MADRDNNTVRLLEFDINSAATLFTTTNNGLSAATNLFSKPVGVALDNNGYLFVLNYAKGTNGYVLEFDYTGQLIATNLTRLTNAAGIALDFNDNIYVTASNQVIKVDSITGASNVVASLPYTNASLQGIVLKRAGPGAGKLAVCDSGRNGIYLIDPNTGIVTTNSGFHGAGDFLVVQNTSTSANSMFFQPSGIAESGDGTLIVTDFGNHRVKAVHFDGSVSNLYGVTSNDWVFFNTPPWQYPGFVDGTVKVPDDLGGVAARQPNGVVMGPDGTIFVTEDYYHIIRTIVKGSTALKPPLPPPPTAPTDLTATTNLLGQVVLNWTQVATATNYNVKRSTSSGAETTIGHTGSGSNTSFTDTNVVSGATYYYVVSAVNAGGEGPNSAEVSITTPIPPPPAPVVGWFDYEGNNVTGFFSVLHSVNGTAYLTHNDLLLAVNPTTNGVSTKYIDGPAPLAGNPGTTNGSTPPFYADGVSSSTPLTPLPVTTVPDLIIKAININGVGESSPIVTAEFKFQVAAPIIIGNNGAQFTVSDETVGAQLWYTTDGSAPTNTGSGTTSQFAGTSNGTNSLLLAISVPASSNVFFQVRGFRANYDPSDIASRTFSSSNFVPNTISFGFTSGEASSDFVGAPGQTFYAPVTLSMLPSTLVYSLQFNLTVTNNGTGVTNSAPPITPGAFSFQSMLVIPGTETNVPVPVFRAIPPSMFASYSTNVVPPSQLYTNAVGLVFANLVITNLSENLLGVGWLERFGRTNLYNTLGQDLIQFSIAHDDLFPNAQQPGGVIVGGYAFQIQTNAQLGQQYQIQIGRPTATDDGVGAPGSSVFLYAPTNGSLVGGAPLNAIKNVTVGIRQYLVGNVYPFRWFNAGDFGNTNLQNADVMQVFQSAIYIWNVPPPGSDFFDAMDSCGSFGALDSDPADQFYNVYTNAGPLSTTDESALFDGNDTTINTNIFGDGVLDVCDVYVTFRRSLDPSLFWFNRYWTNGVRVAVQVPNVFNPSLVKQSPGKFLPALGGSNPSPVSITNTPSVNFTAGDYQATAGQQVTIPVTAAIFGSYPLHMVMLNISVVPLDGSPALTVPIQFNPDPGLGTALGSSTPWAALSSGNGNYSAVWLPDTNKLISQIPGLTGTASIGTLTVTIPANATSSSAYAVHFDHASASPSGLISFPRKTLTGLITLSSRTNSYYSDGIPDSWRLRYFGSIYNFLSVSNADADGTGMKNWQKYVAGLDPTDPNSKLAAGLDQPMAQSRQDSVVCWPSVSGKHYVIQRAASLFPAVWTSVSTNTGTGGYMEIHDSPTNKFRFYRVQVQ